MEINDYYKILNIPPKSSQKKIRKAYGRLSIKFHPYVQKDQKYLNHFVMFHLAYDLLSKLIKKQEGRYRTQSELYEEWLENERQNAIERADYLSKLSTKEFEAIFLKGFNRFTKLAYGLSLTLSTFIFVIPFKLFMEESISLFGLILITVSYSFPIFLLSYRIVQKESGNELKFKFNRNQESNDKNLKSIKEKNNTP